MCIAYWHAWGVSYVMAGCNVVAILSTPDMVCLVCRNCGVHELDLYGTWGLSYVLLMDMADMDQWKTVE